MSENKKSIITPDMEKVSAILLDVAGTTTAISFVKETLYPYVIKNAEEFLKSNFESEDVKKALEKFEEKDLDVTKATAAVKSLTEKDDSNEGLKAIQGLLLKKGYESGELKGHVYEDVPKLFESWSATKKIAIFSSGSVDSQKLLFQNSTEGDLSAHISKFFDLSLGPKVDSTTYQKIAKELEVGADEVLFLTDDVKEAEAAKSADCKVLLVDREGTEKSQADIPVVKSFSDISVEKTKRKIVEEDAAVEAPPTKMAKIEVAEGVIENVQVDKKPETEEKVETAEEAMEVDQEPVAAEKVDDKVSSKDDKSESQKTSDEKSAESDTISSQSEKSEAMEVDSKLNGSNSDKTCQTTEQPVAQEKAKKTETETGTQTKPAVTNEIETQTTISLAAVEELPTKKVEDILMSDVATNIEKKETENKIDEEKSEDSVKNAAEIKTGDESAESKNIEVPEASTSEKDSEKDADLKNGKEEEKDVKEAKEVKEEEAAEKCEKEDKEENGIDKIKDDHSSTSVKENSEAKENGDSCAKVNEEGADKKEENSSNGTQDVKEKKENGVETAEKENKSTLANGKESDVSNGDDADVTKNGAVDPKEEEIKVKKISDNVESAPVSVEA